MQEIALFLLALTVRVAYFFKTGIMHGGDTPFYLQFSDLIASYHSVFGIPDHPFYYSLYPLLLALFTKNEMLIVVVQIILSALSTIAIYLIGSQFFSKRVGIIAGIIHIFSWELFQWDVYILTDSLALSLITIASFLLLKSISTRQALWRLFTSLALMLLLFLRPASFPFIGIAYIFLLVSFRSIKNKFASIFVTCVLLSMLFYVYAMNGGTYSLPFFVQTYATEFADAAIIHHRVYLSLNYDGSLMNSIANGTQIILARFALFWQPFAHTFSLPHIIINSIYFATLYLFSLYYLVVNKSLAIKKEIACIIIIIVTYWLFHSITLIDYDWRYRLTVLPFLIIIASIGIDLFIKKRHDALRQ